MILLYIKVKIKLIPSQIDSIWDEFLEKNIKGTNILSSTIFCYER